LITHPVYVSTLLSNIVSTGLLGGRSVDLKDGGLYVLSALSTSVSGHTGKGIESGDGGNRSAREWDLWVSLEYFKGF